MPESGWDAALRTARLIRLGLAVLFGAAAMAAAIVLWGASLGVSLVVGILVLLLVGLAIGSFLEGEKRAGLEEEAFEHLGPAKGADEIADFYVRQWRPDVSDTLPEFVERDALQKVLDGLATERFVILEGPRFSGRSRIVYEAMLKMEQMVMVAAPTGSEPATDPLLKLMKDPRGFPISSQHQVLVLRDCQERLLAGSIGGDFMRTWLDTHPNVSVLASLGSADLELISAAGPRAGEDLVKLREQAAVVTVSDTLNSEEMKRARAIFLELNEDHLRRLPAYLCSGDLLKKRFEATGGDHELGRAIVRAAADWERSGIVRPAPRRFLEAACGRYVDGRSDDFFEAELSWALERVEGAAALLYEVEGGFAVDGTARDMLDRGDVAPELGRELPGFAWEEVRAEIERAVEDGSPEVDLVDDLVGLERGATERDRPDIADWAFALALRQDAGPRRINQHLVATPKSGPPPSIMRARDGDGFGRRLSAIQQMVEARSARAKRRRSSLSPSRRDKLLVWVYANHALRAIVRCGALFLVDAFSVAVGLTAGLLVRVALSDSEISEVPEVLSYVLGPAVASALAVFFVLSLYKQDAPRAHLSRILSATSMLGFVALVTSLIEDFDPLAAVLGALAGVMVAAWTDYQIRYQYDKRSRKWIKEKKLEVWLLVIGNAAQFKAARAAMDDTTRPTKVIGYLTTDPGDVDKDKKDCLGEVKDLPKVLSPKGVERILIADPEMAPEDRQDLADKFHTRGLPVEAVPSLADIQMGNCEFVAGNSLVLISLHHLWQRNLGFFVKRSFDFVVAAVGLLVLLPILVPIAVLIRVVDKHPPLTKEWRVGLAGNVFGMHRFRTTSEDPEASDPRTIDTNRLTMGTTPLGMMLCRHGLDELPQLYNVLRGQMSLTGPRPLYIKDHIRLGKRHLRRYVVRPGMAGPWQVCERPEFSADELTRLDVAYMRNWTFITDLDLIVKAMRIALKGRDSDGFGQLS